MGYITWHNNCFIKQYKISDYQYKEVLVMCGIIRAVMGSVITPVLQGLGRLEYRGYLSAGIPIVPYDEIKMVKEQEGASKPKKISYIRLKTYTAGELKNGPVALLDKQMAVLVIAPKNNLTDKLLSNIQDVQTRNAPLFIISESSNRKHINLQDDEFFELPSPSGLILPIVSVIPMQLVALYSGQMLGGNINQPKNLAKSVTVE